MNGNYRPSLEYFLVIAEHTSLTRAAEALHVSQQNISIYLKKLEDYYGVQLFLRHPYLKLTPAGENLLDAALHIRDIYNKLDQQLLRHTAAPCVAIGCCRAKIPHLMDYIQLPLFKSKHPEVEVHITEERSAILEKTLLNHQVDFYIGHVGSQSELIEAYPLRSFPYLVSISPTLLKKHFRDSPAEVLTHWQTEGVQLSELKNVPCINAPNGYLRNYIDQYEQQAGFRFSVSAEHSSPDYRIQMCQHDLGFTISELTAEELTRMGLISFPIRVPKLSLDLACIRLKNAPLPSYTEDFLRLIRENASKIPN